MDDADHTPLEPDELDEVLTAELDGELDSVARELGLGTDELSARLRATPGVASRRVSIIAARELLAQIPDLDELAAARLRNAALSDADRELAYGGDPSPDRRQDHGGDRRNRGWLVAVGGLAAAVLAIAGLAVAIGGRAASNSKSTSAAAPSGTAESSGAAKSTVGTLGAFVDARSLAEAAVGRVQAGPASTTTANVPAPSQNGDALKSAASTTAPVERQISGQNTTTREPTSLDTTATVQQSAPAAGVAPFSTADLHRSAKTCTAPPEVPVSGEPAARATATLAGEPVVVLVYAGQGRHIVVIENPECALLNVQTLA